VRRLLVAATRTVNRHITSELQRRGYEHTRPGHSALLANLDFNGSSVTEIAERAQIQSKRWRDSPSSLKRWVSSRANRANRWACADAALYAARQSRRSCVRSQSSTNSSANSHAEWERVRSRLKRTLTQIAGRD